MNKILSMLREPSTYAGISGLMLAIGVSNEQWTTISTALAALAGVAAMILREKGKQ